MYLSKRNFNFFQSFDLFARSEKSFSFFLLLSLGGIHLFNKQVAKGENLSWQKHTTVQAFY